MQYSWRDAALQRRLGGSISFVTLPIPTYGEHDIDLPEIVCTDVVEPHDHRRRVFTHQSVVPRSTHPLRGTRALVNPNNLSFADLCNDMDFMGALIDEVNFTIASTIVASQSGTWMGSPLPVNAQGIPAYLSLDDVTNGVVDRDPRARIEECLFRCLPSQRTMDLTIESFRDKSFVYVESVRLRRGDLHEDVLTIEVCISEFFYSVRGNTHAPSYADNTGAAGVVCSNPQGNNFVGIWQGISLQESRRQQRRNQLRQNVYPSVSSKRVGYLGSNYYINGSMSKAAEETALHALREMVTERAFRRYLRDGFLSVTGQSKRIYQVFKHSAHTKVFDKGKLVCEVCVRIRDFKVPLTDNVLALKTIIETNEEEFLSLGNVYNFKDGVQPVLQGELGVLGGNNIVAGINYCTQDTAVAA